ncbi:MAG: PD-(D/E)XK nuclease family protein [Gammaproteobacteria bacterium]|nr:PD-(D/E)XK nuclease family protein [Gammaproteobacteria bacterium]
MDVITITYESLFERLNVHTIVLTPNRRLAATLQKLYQDYQYQQGLTWWETRDILPLLSWLERLWKDYTANSMSSTERLLSAAQEHLLWEKIIKEDAYHDLLQVTETAELVQKAWGLVEGWQVNIDLPLFNETDDYQALQSFFKNFQQVCETNHWLSSASLATKILTIIENHPIQLPQQIFLIGFNEISPQWQTLLTYCTKQGCAIESVYLIQPEAICQRISFSDAEDEILHMARFAKSRWQENPRAKIGCVVPTLDKDRDRIKQIFSEVFADYSAVSAFNISAGKPLTQYPVIHAGLTFLSLTQNKIDHETLHYLLFSPFIGEAEVERFGRAQLDKYLRERNLQQLNLRAEVCNQNSILMRYAPKLGQRLIVFFDAFEKLQYNLTVSEWMSEFNNLLNLLGWPGERSLMSEEYQTVENWLHLISELKALDYVTEKLSAYSALQHLYQATGSQAFQPQSPEAAIQVLGLLEAAGLPFDFLWIAGLHDLSWPPQPQPNPFLPRRLQREMKMPHADAERELQYCRNLTGQFKQSAKNIIFSHPEHDKELELQPSPLIQDVQVLTIEDLNLQPFQSFNAVIYQRQSLEKIIDTEGPIITPDEKIYGGTSVLKFQAMCPFRAFATWRLHAHELDQPRLGLRAKDRGSILHQVLANLWGKLQNHHTLISIKASELSELIQSSIDTALIKTAQHHSERQFYLKLEAKRLHKLILDWLEIEKKRQPFKVILNEQATEIKINQLTLSLRIDRVDELEDGRKLVIDYKTGQQNEIKHWFSERPHDPQLPLYSLLDPENTIGITFAEVIPGSHRFKGVSHEMLEIKGIKKISELNINSEITWPIQLEQWDAVFKKLSDDFAKGWATLDPKEGSKTCLWCALKPFCRIAEEQNL